MKLFVFLRWFVQFCVLLIVITACDNGGDEQNYPPNETPCTTSPDCGNGGDEQNLPGVSACGTPPAGDFMSPTRLTAVNSTGIDSAPEVTNGNLALYLNSDRSGGYGSSDIYVSDRTSQTDDWGTPVNLGSNINTEFDDRAATVSSDGLTLIFASNRDGDFDLYISIRDSTSDAWGPVSNMGDTINSADMDTGPSLSGDGLTLVFSSERLGGSGLSDLYMSTRASTADAWSAPINIGATVNSAAAEVAPDISCDGLRIYFHTNADIALTERSSLTAPWSTPTIMLEPVSTTSIEITPSISADETTLFFASTRPDSEAHDIWFVTR